MKICILTNYIEDKYSNEGIILSQLKKTLKLSSNDVFNIADFNSVYKVNKEYTHSLIYLDYAVTTLNVHQTYFSEVNIPKVFIIDCIPQKLKDLDEVFSKNLLNTTITHLQTLSKEHQNFLYEEYADGLIFYNNNDIELFKHYYTLKKPIPFTIIPPSLGVEEDIKPNFNKLTPNNNIGFNSEPSFPSGIFNILEALHIFPNYNMNMYGVNSKNEYVNQILVNHLTDNNSSIKFKGKLKNQDTFFYENHIYYNISLYDSFNYFTFISLLNSTIPILSNTSGISEYFIDYPFICDGTPKSITLMLENISNSSEEELKSIIEKTIEPLKMLNDNSLRKTYHEFFKNIKHE